MDASTSPDAQDASQEAPETQYASLDDFVENLVAVIFEVPTDRAQQVTWCPQWWMHDGATFMLMSLWQAWEHMRVNEGPEAGAKWLTYYAFPIMDRLMAPGGVFAHCTTNRGHEDERPHADARLPCVPAPEGLLTPRQ